MTRRIATAWSSQASYTAHMLKFGLDHKVELNTVCYFTVLKTVLIATTLLLLFISLTRYLFVSLTIINILVLHCTYISILKQNTISIRRPLCLTFIINVSVNTVQNHCLLMISRTQPVGLLWFMAFICLNTCSQNLTEVSSLRICKKLAKSLPNFDVEQSFTQDTNIKKSQEV